MSIYQFAKLLTNLEITLKGLNNIPQLDMDAYNAMMQEREQAAQKLPLKAISEMTSQEFEYLFMTRTKIDE